VRLTVLIVDDEPLPREGLRMFLAGDPDTASILEARNGPEAVELITNRRPDLVFLDVQMPRMDGFQVIETAGADRMPAVIFVTAYDSYAVRAFEVNAVDYLLKPVAEDRFRAAFSRAKERMRNESAEIPARQMRLLLEGIANPKRYLTRLAVRGGGRIFFVDVTDIDWVEAAENYVQLHVGGRRHLLHVSMTTFAAALDPESFIRIHRSAIVNSRRIKSLSPATHGQYIVVLENGVELQSGRNYSDAIRSLITNRYT
jgi:two-component system LytT family response regulator